MAEIKKILFIGKYFSVENIRGTKNKIYKFG